jgi:hypothetical protein
MKNFSFLLEILLLISVVCLCFAEGVFVYDAQGRRNPFVPLVTSDGRLIKIEKKQPQEGVLLEGIIYDTHGISYAIVNGAVVKVGDKIGDYQILKIAEKKVIFIKEGELIEVLLKEAQE